MRRLYIHTHFYILLLIASVHCTEFTHDHKRVGPRDQVLLEHGCLQKFKVRENSIIQTQDSRNMGAKFLNESDVGNREDCLNLCCNTQFCNVAVFQEESPFSCYLFDCGETKNFRCSFISHTSYTSALLRVNRHQLDLRLWSAQHQHESELANLRSEPSAVGPVPTSLTKGQEVVPMIKKDLITTLPSTTTISPSTPPSTAVVATSTKLQPPDRKCRGFQFECHSGECIAIYNACDGIPQCQDGSDEGPDLGCPRVENPVDSRSSSASAGNDGKQRVNLQTYLWNTSATPRRNSGTDSEIFNHRYNLLEYGGRNYQNAAAANSDYVREDGLNYNNALGKGASGYYDYNNRPRQDLNAAEPPSIYHREYPDYSFTNHQTDRGLHQHSGSQAVPPPPQQQQQIPIQPQNIIHSGQQPVYQARSGMNHNQAWQAENARYPYTTEQQQQPQGLPQPLQQITLQHDGPQLKPIINKGLHQGLLNSQVPSNSNPQINRAYYHTMNSQKGPVYLIPQKDSISPGAKNSNRKFGNYTSAQLKNPNVFPKAAENNSQSQVSPDETLQPVNQSSELSIRVNKISSDKKEATKPKIKDKEPNSDGTGREFSAGSLPAHLSLSSLEVDLRELRVKAEEQSDQASGAVLALSLGVCITGLLVILVGCRMKGAKRRMRRHRSGKSSLEHDSDYLVNGMYL